MLICNGRVVNLSRQTNTRNGLRKTQAILITLDLLSLKQNIACKYLPENTTKAAVNGGAIGQKGFLDLDWGGVSHKFNLIHALFHGFDILLGNIISVMADDKGFRIYQIREINQRR